jgi:hypothetical protein
VYNTRSSYQKLFFYMMYYYSALPDVYVSSSVGFAMALIQKGLIGEKLSFESGPSDSLVGAVNVVSFDLGLLLEGFMSLLSIAEQPGGEGCAKIIAADCVSLLLVFAGIDSGRNFTAEELRLPNSVSDEDFALELARCSTLQIVPSPFACASLVLVHVALYRDRLALEGAAVAASIVEVPSMRDLVPKFLSLLGELNFQENLVSVLVQIIELEPEAVCKAMIAMRRVGLFADLVEDSDHEVRARVAPIFLKLAEYFCLHPEIIKNEVGMSALVDLVAIADAKARAMALGILYEVLSKMDFRGNGEGRFDLFENFDISQNLLLIMGERGSRLHSVCRRARTFLFFFETAVAHRAPNLLELCVANFRYVKEVDGAYQLLKEVGTSSILAPCIEALLRSSLVLNEEDSGSLMVKYSLYLLAAFDPDIFDPVYLKTFASLLLDHLRALPRDNIFEPLVLGALFNCSKSSVAYSAMIELGVLDEFRARGFQNSPLAFNNITFGPPPSVSMAFGVSASGGAASTSERSTPRFQCCIQ